MTIDRKRISDYINTQLAHESAVRLRAQTTAQLSDRLHLHLYDYIYRQLRRRFPIQLTDPFAGDGLNPRHELKMFRSFF